MGYIYSLHCEKDTQRSIGLLDFVMEIVRILLCILCVMVCVHYYIQRGFLFLSPLHIWPLNFSILSLHIYVFIWSKYAARTFV